ncbi:histidine kinase [Pedobacter yulinensis]|uniref:histidine kinase n=1 Tax=Pedobacter yulinensis TaxID=2126353 RepID=A0A2T3HRR8_9SPHI|nr:response regulator [Pedobacter yulinensis]PST85142.1 histidine kinase [Pedobacter yulinensis]
MSAKLKSNLRLGLGLSLLLLVISSLASFISLQNLNKASGMVTKTNDILRNLEQILSTLKDAETGQRGYLLTGDKAFLEPYNGASDRAQLLLNQVETKTADNPLQQKNIAVLREIIVKRLDILRQSIAARANGIGIANSTLITGKEYMDEARAVVTAMAAEERRLLAERTADQTKLARYTPVLIVIAALLSVLITSFFYYRVSNDFDARMKLANELDRKNREIDRRIAAIQAVAAQISSGDYNIRMDQADIKDGLGSLAGSMNAMAQSLQESFGRLADEEWLQTGIANLNNKMVGEKNEVQLVEDVVETLAQYTESVVGAMYVLGLDNKLYLTGGYGLDKTRVLTEIEMGSGLLGQAAKSLKALQVEGVREADIVLSHATGQLKPGYIVAQPILRYGQCIAVLELASLEPYSQIDLMLLNRIAENVGLALFSAQNRRRLQELLEETQAQSEELQVQHNELEGLNAELEAQTQKLQASEEELRVQQEELLQSNQELEERSALLEEKNQLIEERNADIQVKAAQLEQSTKYKSEFLANMSHELRTPLNSILLLSKLLSENQEIEKEYVEYAEVIQSSGQGLLALIDEILDLSKIEAGKMTLERQTIQVSEVLQDMRLLFDPQATNKGLKLVIDEQPGVPDSLFTDKMRLEQVLKNLLSNAIKFTAEGQVILSVAPHKSPDFVRFSVTDTGIGIARDKQAMIFEAFQQADGSTRRRFGGTGLGLSISRELAKLLGGEISLKSVEGKGSTFSIVLPRDATKVQAVLEEEVALVPVPVEAITAEADTIPETHRVARIPLDVADDRNEINPGDKVILIIEDDTSFAKVLLDFTRKRGYKGIVAVRGDVGIEMAQKFNPLAILLDIQLPVKDGWEVMQELKSNQQTRPIPVHIMSSLEVKKESLLKGAVDFINKPVAIEHMQQIFRKLEDALSKHPKKVLIVEENQQHAKALSYFLSNFNIQTEIVDNVSSGVDALQKSEVNCVILDMGVPDKTAYDTLEVIKQNPGLENLPIIIFTGKNLSKGEERRIRQYADSIVVKTAHSYQRILDEAALFLHLVEEKTEDKKAGASPVLGAMREVLREKTVLIADDDVRNIFSITKALEQHKMKVIPATDGKEALEILKKNPGINVVLMDMMMPEMDGYESIREIRKIHSFKNLPILAVTAKAMMGDREKCIAAGASDYISKPVDIDQLISLLRVWLYDAV